MAFDPSMRVTPVAAPIREQVYQNLRQAIIEMRFKPGQRLIERELIEMTNASRTSVREALRELAADGLVTTVPHNRTIVVIPRKEEASELYEIRGMLESLATRIFVEQATDEEIAELRQLLDNYAYAESGLDRLRAKDLYYDLLGSHSQTTYSILTDLRARITMLRSMSLSEPGRHSISVKEMYKIMEAIERRDAEEAARACLEHALSARSSVLSMLGDNWPSDDRSVAG